MKFAKSFMEVMAGELIDPELKVDLSLGRFNLEDSSMQVNIAYDPEIRADRLYRPLTAKEIEFNKAHKLVGPEFDKMVFHSEQHTEIDAFFVNEIWELESSTLNLLCTFNADRYRLYKKIVDLRKFPRVVEYPAEFIEYILSSIGQLYGSYVKNPHVEQRWARQINLMIDKSLIPCLPNSKNHKYEEFSPTYVVFDSLEVV
jgi:hypothetical protein